MTIRKLEKVFCVRASLSREKIEKIHNQPDREYKRFELFVAANNASDALEGASQYMSEYLKEHEEKGFDSIEISQSFTNWLFIENVK